MKLLNAESHAQRIAMIMLGTAIYAFGLHYFIIPNELMEGGVTGIALLLKYTLNLSPSITTLVLNIPLFYFGFRTFGRSTMLYTVIGTVALSFFLWLIEWFAHNNWIRPFEAKEDMILAVLYAGVTAGAGLGIVFRAGGTTGGVDIVARAAQRSRGWSMGQFILGFDAAVIGVSLFYISQEKVLYTLVFVFIATKLIDFVQEGAYAAKAFTVVSEKAEEISKYITVEMDRGVTLFPAKGAFSQQDKQVVYCIVYRHEMRHLRSIIYKMDPRAFIVIHDVHDVLGEGFKTE